MMINFAKLVSIFTFVLFITSCGSSTNKKAVAESSMTITEKVDDAVKVLEENISSFNKITSLDHHRMAAEVGVYTPPSIATIFSDSKVDVALILDNQLVGLDLPFKVLCYAEADTLEVKLAFTSAEFIQKRHNLEPDLLADYKASMDKVLGFFPQEMVCKTDVTKVNEGFGVVNIMSDFDYTATVQKLRGTVRSQADTKWFANVDYQREASMLGVNIRPTMLLLFGAPAPGGKAMVTTPKIGLDAFCQKILVYEKENGEVWLAYNDIAAFAELYYQKSTNPQQMINQRLKATFTTAVTKQ